MTHLLELEQQIAHQRRLLDAWLDEMYRDCEEKRDIGEWGCSDEGWPEI